MINIYNSSSPGLDQETYNKLFNTNGVQGRFDPFNSRVIISEQTDDDKKFSLMRIKEINLDTSTVNYEFKDIFQEIDRSMKEDFLQKEDYGTFNDIIVICQIRRDFTIEVPYRQTCQIIKKAIFKGVRNILIEKKLLSSKEEFNDKKDYVRIFTNDIQVSYITTTGQLKSATHIYVHQSLTPAINGQPIHLSFKKQEIKIIAYFSQIPCPEYPQPAPPPLYVKQAFFRDGKLKSEFLIFHKSNDEDTKNGTSIFYAYRYFDDQIYAIKKSRMNSKELSYHDVFSTIQMGEMTPDQRKIREAKILAKLTHPNILRLYDWWIEQDQTYNNLYMQLEYCSYPGFKHQTNDLLTFSYYYLNPKCKKDKVETIRNIMFQIIAGLEYIHRRGIIHRDLKPENIFVTINIQGELQVMLADFDQGKDVRESKLSLMTDRKLTEQELNSIKAKNTIHSGTSGYQTPNSLKDRAYDQYDEFYALGMTLLHLILTFPGEPKTRNSYAATFGMSEVYEVLQLFDNWANKYVKNKHKDFVFADFGNQLELAKKLLDKKIKTHDQIRQIINSW